MSGDSNGRVTIAIVGTKVDHLTERLTEFQQEMRSGFDRMDACYKEEREKREALELEVALLKQRGGVLASLLVVLNLIGSSVAAFLGTRK